jgi:hypothetical protein
MKFIAWTLVFTTAVYAVSLQRFTLPAHAAETTVGAPTSNNGNNNQENTQEDTEDLNDAGAAKSNMLGMAAIAAGSAMVAAGMACQPAPCAGLIAAGMALIAAGMLGLAAASQMNQNANRAGYNAGKMSGLSTSHLPSTNGMGSSASGAISIDPNLTRSGKVDAIFEDFENKTGVSREDLINGLSNGEPLESVLAKGGKMGASEAELAKMMADAQAGEAMSGTEVMEKLGLEEKDLGGEGENVYAGGGAARGPASAATTPDLSAFFQKPGEEGPSVLGGTGLKLSEEVQDALDRSGITDRTIFQMVHIQYKKKTPMLFGVSERRPSSFSENPLGDLGDTNLEL